MLEGGLNQALLSGPQTEIPKTSSVNFISCLHVKLAPQAEVFLSSNPSISKRLSTIARRIWIWSRGRLPPRLTGALQVLWTSWKYTFANHMQM